jgi:soluble lytic murein transglycosylase
MNALLEGDLDLLEEVSDSAISKVFSRTPRRDAFVALEKAVLESKPCNSVRVATLMGSKFEEFLPGKEQLDATIALYQKAAACDASPEFSERARYRASLLLIAREDWTAAIPLLEKLARNKESDFYSRAIYWRARAEKSRGNRLGFRQLASRLTKEFPIHYHSLLLAPRVLFSAAQNLHLSEPVVALRCRNIGKEWDSRIRAVEALHEAGAPEFARRLLSELEDQMEGAEPEARLYLAVLQHRSQNTIGTFRVLSSLFREHPAMLSRQTLVLFFPLSKPFESFLNVAQGGGLDPYLIAALIRQESGFVPHARSRAGALGLMQLMPATARSLEAVSKRELLDGRTNVRLGVKFFRQLLNRFGGKVDHALAAYNAGPLRVEEWQRRYPVNDPVLFVDLIPIKETREYVSLISRNYYWYLQIYARHIFDERVDAAIVRASQRGRMMASTDTRPGNNFPLEFSLFHSH